LATRFGVVYGAYALRDSRRDVSWRKQQNARGAEAQARQAAAS